MDDSVPRAMRHEEEDAWNLVVCRPITPLVAGPQEPGHEWCATAHPVIGGRRNVTGSRCQIFYQL